ncbi:hypothetical protein JB92DRAFT_3096190 [Gautieria morchelliformis]|nr:hypothetical protein JB92DRAFT_3096190 [Gautieria morchelliformis]
MDVSGMSPQIVFHSQVAGTRSAAGALSLVIFDILLTLDAERVCIWRAPLSLTKGCYLTGRYLGLLNLVLMFSVYAADVTHSSCATWKWYFLVIVLSSMASCNVLLALRLDSLFRNTRYFRLLLIVLCTCGLVAETVLLCLFSASSVAPKQQPSVGCIYTINSLAARPLSFIFTLPELGLTCIYFSLALHRLLKHVRERSSIIGHRAIRDSGNITSTLSLILRDGVVFYAMVLILIQDFRRNFRSWIAILGWIACVGRNPGSRLVLALHGNPRETMGIYQQGTELWVTPLNRGDDMASGLRENTDPLLWGCPAVRLSFALHPSYTAMHRASIIKAPTVTVYSLTLYVIFGRSWFGNTLDYICGSWVTFQNAHFALQEERPLKISTIGAWRISP